MWGVISTTSLHLNGTAYGNVFDYSDGQIDNPTGRIFLFIDGLDYSPKDFKVNPFVSFTISEEVMGQGCSADPEDPTYFPILDVFQVHGDQNHHAQSGLISKLRGEKKISNIVL